MALISRIGFTLFDRWGTNLGRLAYSAATHTEALDGTDELKITCDRELSKGQRVVWVDRQGKAHEHLVDEVAQMHDDGGKTYCEAVCINSVAELLDDYIEDKRPSGGVAEALTSILGGTRWEVGTCDLKASASHTFYHTSVREGLTDLIATWGGELETRIETDGAKVTHRYIGVRASRGDQQSPKRFTWTKDIVDIKRTVGSANPKTRVYGYGKGVETDSGGYGRRLTFGDVNGGKDYVEDAEATKIWGHPDGKGGILPAVDTYINEQCEDAAQLLQETKDYLESAKEPTVSYEANVLDLYAYGRAWEGVALGDCVAIIDKQFAESGIRLKGRVSQIERDLMTAETTVTFGNLVDALTDMWETVAGALKSGSASRANYDAVANPSVGWLTLLQSALNKQFNAVGTYKVESFELGQIFSNVALNPETGTPVKTTSGMWAVNINGMGIRLASQLTAQGEWDWTTFITGASVTADCINTGTMHADRVRAGLLTDEVGKNFWNLDTGDFHLSPGNVEIDNDGNTLDDSLKELTDDLEKTTDSLSNLRTSLSDLNTTVDDLASDGIVTEAEKAAVNKILQTIEKEQSDLSSEYSTLSNSTSLNSQYKTSVLKPKYEAAFGKNQAYDNLQDCINKVLACQTSDDLEDAIREYKSAYSTYANAVNAYHSAAYSAKSTIEQSKAKATAQGLLDDYDDTITQTEIFNRLTNNGATQGIYMSSGKLYINGTYLSTGIISDKYSRNTWNLNTGALSTNYMTAKNITATGTFQCGYSSYYTLLNTSGQMSGYRIKSGATSATQVGYIDFSASMNDLSDGTIKYGLQLQGEGSLRISVPKISVGTSSNTSVTTTNCLTKSTTFHYTSNVSNGGNGTIKWTNSTRTLSFVNGLCTVCGLD